MMQPSITRDLVAGKIKTLARWCPYIEVSIPGNEINKKLTLWKSISLHLSGAWPLLDRRRAPRRDVSDDLLSA